MAKIDVKGTVVTVISQNDEDYISLTDMIKAKEGVFFIDSWLRNRNTVEFLGIWESIHNPDFNYVEFDVIKSKAGLNSFKMSVKEWVEKTNAIGLIAKTGRYGGTYANKDIAFEFGMWINPEFKLYLIKEFQNLKALEKSLKNEEWDYRRFLSKVNYRIQTDAIKDTIIPKYKNLTKEQEGYIYANEAEILNMALFGQTAKQWRETNPDLHLKGENIRAFANIPQLTVLSNLENYNAILIKKGIAAKERLEELKAVAITQLQSLSNQKYNYPIESPNKIKYEQDSTFDQTLKGILSVPKPPKENK